MRRVGCIFALVFVTGCSLVWNMDPYESGGDGQSAALPASKDAGPSNATNAGDASNDGSNGSNDFDPTDASMLESGAPATPEAGVDAGNTPCNATEVEPNETPSKANDIESGGKMCGAVSTPVDDDWFEILVLQGPLPIAIELGANVRVEVHYGTGGGAYSDTPGVKGTSLTTGPNQLHFRSSNGGTGSYSFRLP